DCAGIDLELVGEVSADHLEDLVAGHGVETVAAAADEPAGSSAVADALAGWSAGEDASRGGRSAPASSSAARVRPITSCWTPRAATSMACAKPRALNRPWATTPSCLSPSMYAPPGP